MAATYVFSQVMPLQPCEMVLTPVDRLCNILLGYDRYSNLMHGKGSALTEAGRVAMCTITV